MIRLSLRDLWSRKLRTILTMLAIVLGVAMIAGTYVITDQIDNGLSQHLREGGGRHRRDRHPQGRLPGHDSLPPAARCRSAMLAQVQAVSGVADAAGTVEGSGAVVVNGRSVDRRGAHAGLLVVAATLQPAARTRRRPADREGTVAINAKLATTSTCTWATPSASPPTGRAEGRHLAASSTLATRRRSAAPRWWRPRWPMRSTGTTSSAVLGHRRGRRARASGPTRWPRDLKKALPAYAE